MDLLLVFLRFVLRDLLCIKIYLITVISLLAFYFMALLLYQHLPLRYPLLALYLVIVALALHQVSTIRDILLR